MIYEQGSNKQVSMEQNIKLEKLVNTLSKTKLDEWQFEEWTGQFPLKDTLRYDFSFGGFVRLRCPNDKSVNPTMYLDITYSAPKYPVRLLPCHYHCEKQYLSLYGYIDEEPWKRYYELVQRLLVEREKSYKKIRDDTERKFICEFEKLINLSENS